MVVQEQQTTPLLEEVSEPRSQKSSRTPGMITNSENEVTELALAASRKDNNDVSDDSSSP
jgi:hypothetical protein